MTRLTRLLDIAEMLGEYLYEIRLSDMTARAYFRFVSQWYESVLGEIERETI